MDKQYQASDGTTNDLEAEVKMQLTWTKSDAVFPYTSCEGHCAAVVGPHLYVFGGVIQDEEDEMIESNELYKLHVDSQIWLKVDVTGDIPHPRCNATMTAVGAVIYLFGGLSHSQGWFNDFYAFDTETGVWRRVKCDGTPPSPRDKLASVVVGSNIYFFGGFGPKSTIEDENEVDEDDDGYSDGEIVGDLTSAQNAANFGWFNELFVYNSDTQAWNQPLQMNLGVPTPRAAHSICAIQKRLIIFGGKDIDGRCNDLHVFDTETRKWDSNLQISGDLPEPRSFHSAVTVGGLLFVVGGRGPNNEHFGDIHILDTERWLWLQPSIRGDKPVGRGTHTCHIVGENLVLFGGSSDFNADISQCETFFTDTNMLNIGNFHLSKDKLEEV